MSFPAGEVRAALANAMDGIAAAYGKKLRATPFVSDAPDPPWAYPFDMSWVLDSMDDTWTATASVRILTSSQEDRAGQEHLDVLIPAVIDALNATPGLSVSSGTGYDLLPVGEDGLEYYGAELEVSVLPEVLG